MKMKIPPPKWPQVYTCAKCGGELFVYPRPNEPKGFSICKICTPFFYEWSEFAKDMSKGYPGFEE